MRAPSGRERLWLTEPRRKTCLAEVVDRRGPWFAVDRALFAPKSRATRHPQPADKGIVWVGGDKRKLGGVKEAGGDVWYRLRGTVPDLGQRLQCEIDAAWRDQVCRAHTAMHLLLASLPGDAPPMIADPEVRGGGHVRLTFAWPVAPPTLAKALEAANGHVAADVPVEASFVDRVEATHGATPQAFDPADPVPGDGPVRLVSIGDVCAYPCDGTHADRTGDVGRIAIVHARQGKDGFVVVGRARRA